MFSMTKMILLMIFCTSLLMGQGIDTISITIGGETYDRSTPTEIGDAQNVITVLLEVIGDLNESDVRSLIALDSLQVSMDSMGILIDSLMTANQELDSLNKSLRAQTETIVEATEDIDDQVEELKKNRLDLSIGALTNVNVPKAVPGVELGLGGMVTIENKLFLSISYDTNPWEKTSIVGISAGLFFFTID